MSGAITVDTWRYGPIVVCHTNALGICLAHPDDPLHCTYCGRVLDTARAQVQQQLAAYDRTLLDRVRADLDAEKRLRDALDRLVVLIHRARRPWWRA